MLSCAYLWWSAGNVGGWTCRLLHSRVGNGCAGEFRHVCVHIERQALERLPSPTNNWSMSRLHGQSIYASQGWGGFDCLPNVK